MPSRSKPLRWISSLVLGACALLPGRAALAQELPRVTATRKLSVGGVSVDPKIADLLGLGRIQFQGLIASELANVGYSIDNASEPAPRQGDAAPLTLTGSVREEICDDIAPSQCRVAILWDLEDARGVTRYRALTRAVEQERTLEELRRGLIRSALHSLLKRRRFALQLTDVEAAQPATGPLGFKHCRRPSLELPRAARSAAASLVLVESGSNLASGSILSGDGLILTSAKSLLPDAPLRVRFSAQQTLPAEIVAIERSQDIAVVHVASNTDTTCLPLRDDEIAIGAELFGVGSELSEDVTVSLSAGRVRRLAESSGRRVIEVDAAIARAEGAPLLDTEGRLVAVVAGARSSASDSAGGALSIASALEALSLKPAAVTDPRLLGASARAPRAAAYVRDRDDPPFVLTRRYTYGTSTTARRLRTASFAVTGVAALGVAATWLSFRANPNQSSGAHARAVTLNDVSWVLLGLGAVGVGVSFAWPEGHDTVEGHGSARRELFIGVAAGGVGVRGSL